MKSKWRLNKIMPIDRLFTTPRHSPKKTTTQNKLNLTKSNNWRKNRTVVGRWEASLFVCLFLIYLVIHHLADKAATSASPSWALNFHDGVALLFSSFIPSFSTLCPLKMHPRQCFELFDMYSSCWTYFTAKYERKFRKRTLNKHEGIGVFGR